MTENYMTEAFDKMHRDFGGIIYPSDFNNEIIGAKNNNGSPIASRIMSDWQFDKMCKKNAMLRDNTY